MRANIEQRFEQLSKKAPSSTTPYAVLASLDRSASKLALRESFLRP